VIVKKITTGFVIQDYDTEKRKFISQEFVAGDEVEVVYTRSNNGEYFDSSEVEGLDESYLSFDMLQPNTFMLQLGRWYVMIRKRLKQK
jgi:hypothetical protein